MRRTPRACFLNPQHPYLTNPDAQAPLGMLYVAASAREAGFEVSFRNLTSTPRLAEAEIPKAEVYGITGTALDLPRVHDLALELKKRDPKSKVVLGGPIVLSDRWIDRRNIDSLIYGEGEREFVRLLRDWPDLNPSYVGTRIEDLDSLPFPARDLLGGHLGGDVFAGGQRFYGEQSTVISTSRGCPCICTFCASPKIWGRHVVYRSAASVTSEMEQVIHDYGVRQFRFSDDNLTCDQKKLTDMCLFLKGKKIAWRASIRVLPNSVEMFQMMKAAGCVEVCFGIESGDPDVLRALKKGAGVNDNRTAIINAKKAGLLVRILFMIGTPGESRDTVFRNIHFFESLLSHFDSIALTNFTPLPGCAVAEDPEAHRCQIHDPWNLSDFNLCMWGPDGRNHWHNFILPDGLSVAELTENKRRMSEYVISTGKTNQG
jgi:radical SAM superfamily enzyme YgiQ (UPF0313 family)